MKKGYLRFDMRKIKLYLKIKCSRGGNALEKYTDQHTSQFVSTTTAILLIDLCYCVRRICRRKVVHILRLTKPALECESESSKKQSCQIYFYKNSIIMYCICIKKKKNNLVK